MPVIRLSNIIMDLIIKPKTTTLNYYIKNTLFLIDILTPLIQTPAPKQLTSGQNVEHMHRPLSPSTLLRGIRYINQKGGFSSAILLRNALRCLVFNYNHARTSYIIDMLRSYIRVHLTEWRYSCFSYQSSGHLTGCLSP